MPDRGTTTRVATSTAVFPIDPDVIDVRPRGGSNIRTLILAGSSVEDGGGGVQYWGRVEESSSVRPDREENMIPEIVCDAVDSLDVEERLERCCVAIADKVVLEPVTSIRREEDAGRRTEWCGLAVGALGYSEVEVKEWRHVDASQAGDVEAKVLACRIEHGATIVGASTVGENTFDRRLACRYGASIIGECRSCGSNQAFTAPTAGY